MKKLSPEEILLNLNKNENEKGKLKIFLGYSAGVGKTYHMLDLANSKKQIEKHILIGYVELHERKDTLALLENFEIIPAKNILYKQMNLKELDVEKVIYQKPKIVLIDEFAHSNLPGQRHKKRYEDIEEILENGIDVYTTLNIQHIESISKIVEEFANIKIREVVPDAIVKNADNIELIDFDPNELIERMNSGKIYQNEKINAAKQNFFTIDNLIKLRELSFRYMADIVDRQNIAVTLKSKLIYILDESKRSLEIIEKINKRIDIINSNVIIGIIEKPNYENLKIKRILEVSEIPNKNIEKMKIFSFLKEQTEENEISKILILKDILRKCPILNYKMIKEFSKIEIDII